MSSSSRLPQTCRKNFSFPKLLLSSSSCTTSPRRTFISFFYFAFFSDKPWQRTDRRKGRDFASGGVQVGGLGCGRTGCNAFCLAGGKIVVFTGLLKHFRSDAEVATIVGHEVGHAVARHVAERITKNFWMEIEADHIGVLLMASAGHDPRVAPLVYEKFGKLKGDSALRDYLSTHPSGKKRAQLLAQAQVMVEALSIYIEAIAGQGILGFL